MSLQPLIIALPKGRILDEALPIVRRAGIEPEAALADDSSRALQFSTNLPYVRIIRVRSFDVATFVAFGAAHLGIAGNDVLMEFDYSEIYAPLDLGIGKCRLSIAQRADMGEDLDLSRLSQVPQHHLEMVCRARYSSGMRETQWRDGTGACVGPMPTHC